jgi:hypothetical protein
VLDPLQKLASETTLEVPPVVPKAGLWRAVVSIMRALSFQSASRRSRTTVSASSTAGDEGSLPTDGLGGNLVTFPSHPVLDTDFTSGSSSGSVRVEEADNADAQPASTSGSESRTSLHEKDEEVDVPPSSTTGSETASVHETEEEERDLLPDQPSPESPRCGSPSPRGLSKTEVWRSTCYSLRQRESGGLRAWARCPRAAS